MITLSEINEAYRNGTPEEKKEFIELILPEIIKNRFFEEKVSIIVEKVLLTSELKTIKRIADLENVTGLKDYSDFEEEEGHAPTLPEQITVLAEKIEHITVTCKPALKPVEEETPENPIITNTTLTQKATALKEYLKEKIKPNWSGKTVIENEGIYEFFYNEIEENLRWPDKLKGYRSAKKEIIERAQELFPNEVEVVRNKSGNKITGLALKTYGNRRDTYGC